MKFWKHTLLAACCFFTVASIVLVSSCEKDACTELKCKNGSACTDGFCRCPTGYEGAECDFKTINRFIGTYYGYNHCDQVSALLDTLEVYKVAEPNVVGFYLHTNNPGDRFEGTVNNFSVTVPDFQAGEFIRKVQLDLDANNISLFVERDFDASNPGAKSICVFSGTRNR